MTQRNGPGKGPGGMEIRMSSAGMTSLHRAGLAGLWMTLDVFQDQPDLATDLGKCGSWELSDAGVDLHWKEPSSFFEALFKASFQLDANGLFWFPGLGLGRPIDNPEQAGLLQDALLYTFLQHGRTRKAEKAQASTGALRFPLDDGRQLSLTYRKVSSYQHQLNHGAARFDPQIPNRLVGWLYPGGAERHVGLQGRTTLADAPGLALVLRFAPVGVFYLRLQQRSERKSRPRFALVIPEIEELATYAEARRVFARLPVWRLLAAGTEEAALRVASELASHRIGLHADVSRCRVVSFGAVQWNPQQKVRVDVFDGRAPSEADLQVYRDCELLLSPYRVMRDDGEHFWSVPQTPALIARNLLRREPWWHGFANLATASAARDWIFRYEKGGLGTMVETHLGDGPEHIFVSACHEAWRHTLARLGARARKEGTQAAKLFDREFTRLRVGFSRSKNAATLRREITDFWARSAPLPSLQESWPAVLALLDERNWQKARDLALLALASYKPRTKEEAEALTETAELAPEGEKGEE